MFEIDAPEEISPGSYDRRLARGWFRTGSFLARASILCIEDTLREVVHIRLPLARHRPSKSRRRLIRRNRGRFRCEIGPARVDAARCDLYEQMKPRFVSPIARDLEPLVFGLEPRIFDTRECAVYDADELVAVSYFDVGRASFASMLGLHAPEYARFGLGIYTMLEEIDAARASGARFYYPGFIVPGLAGFDYKLSLGEVQFLGTDGRWRRRARVPKDSPGAARLLEGLAAAERALHCVGVAGVIRLYQGFGLGYVDELEGAYLRGPAHVQLVPTGTRDDLLIVEFEPTDARYSLIRAEPDPTIDLLEEFDPFLSPPNSETQALRLLEVLARSPSEHEIARALRAQLDAGG